MTAYHKVLTAMSILQAHVLASDSALDGDKLFAGNRMESPALEQVHALLFEILPDLDGDQPSAQSAS